MNRHVAVGTTRQRSRRRSCDAAADWAAAAESQAARASAMAVWCRCAQSSSPVRWMCSCWCCGPRHRRPEGGSAPLPSTKPRPPDPLRPKPGDRRGAVWRGRPPHGRVHPAGLPATRPASIGVSATATIGGRAARARVDVSGTNAHSRATGISSTSERRVFETRPLVVDPGDLLLFPEAAMYRLPNPHTTLPPAPAAPTPPASTPAPARHTTDSVRAACPDTRWAA